jgi:chaperonin GroEL
LKIAVTQIKSGQTNARIIGGKGQASILKARIAQIRRAIEQTKSDFDREKLQERLAKLSGGVAVINVGAATEVEMKERKERVNDAVAATRAALEEGIVPGGGVALLRARNVLIKLKDKMTSDDEKIGVDILHRSLAEPMRMIAQNAGADAGWVLHQVEESKVIDFGFNAMKMEFGSMLTAGIVDPAMVTRSALQNAASVATMILTTEALVTDLPEKNAPAGGPGGGMPGMGGMDY